MGTFDRRAFLLRTGGVVGAVALDWRLAADALAGVDPRLRELARAVAGPVLVPGSAAYASARPPYNARYSSIHPLGIVQPLGAADVRQAVLWARKKHVRLAARSGGHSYAGYSTSSGLVVDLRRVNAVTFNRTAGTATIGAGARLIDVDRTLAAGGVAVPAGSCPTVGLGGLAQGGGVGLSSRLWGTTADNIMALKLVTADGRIRTCSAHRNADLFWACRGGGGGNFGIVTSFTLRVHPVSQVAYFIVGWPWVQVEEVVRAWQAFAPHAADGLFSLCTLGTGPAGPHVQAFGQFFGSEAQLRATIAPLLQVAGARLTVGSSSWLDAQLRWAGCLGKTTARCQAFVPTSFAAKSDYANAPVAAAGVATMRRWIERAQADRFGSGSLLLDSYGGAINRVPAAATAFVHRNALFSAQYLAYWRGGGAAALAWIRGFYAAMRPHVSGFAYQNYIDPDLAHWQHAYYGSNYARLVQIKKRHDPDGFFRFKQGIPPA
ncbi:MAG: FAD-binding oxidoreductase [Gaiellaceae bacterium]